MAVSLDQAVIEYRKDIEAFNDAWLAKHLENPEMYPLEFEDKNAGLWFEFFITFMQTGEI